MHSPRAIFLDVDGTYASHGLVPAAHVAAVRAARAAGNKVLLCTGRPVSALPATLTSAGFDGVVGGAGAYAEVGGKVLADVRFPADLARTTVAALAEHGTFSIYEAPESLYVPQWPPGSVERTRRAYGGGVPPSPASIVIAEIDDLSTITFAKVVCLGGDVPLLEIARDIGPRVAIVPTSVPDVGSGQTSGEIYLAHINKAIGMRIAIDALGVTTEDVVAFGDGINDLEMLEFAGTAVAIEGSDPRVLAAADRTAKGPQHEGLAAAFAELGLVG